MDATLEKSAKKYTDLFSMPAEVLMDAFMCIENGDRSEALQLADQYEAFKELKGKVKENNKKVSDKKSSKKLTDNEFWSSLLHKVKYGRKEAFLKPAILIEKAYDQNLNFLTGCCISDDIARQVYVGDPDNDRWMLCFTSRKDAKKIADQYRFELMKMPVQFVVNNMFNKKSIKGLIFNMDSENEFRISKAELEIVMPGEKPKPEGFTEK